MSFGNNKKKKPEEADLDITPMIDVTFLLLIFFMVTSTMQATPDKDLASAHEGDTANVAAWKNLTILAPKTPKGDPQILLEGKATGSLEGFKSALETIVRTSGGKDVNVMIYAERTVKSGDTGDVEGVIKEVANEQDAKINLTFAVKEKK